MDKTKKNMNDEKLVTLVLQQPELYDKQNLKYKDFALYHTQSLPSLQMYSPLPDFYLSLPTLVLTSPPISPKTPELLAPSPPRLLSPPPSSPLLPSSMLPTLPPTLSPTLQPASVPTQRTQRKRKGQEDTAFVEFTQVMTQYMRNTPAAEPTVVTQAHTFALFMETSLNKLSAEKQCEAISSMTVYLMDMLRKNS